MMTIPQPQVDAQVATTTVQGTVYRADGSVTSGTLQVSWPSFTTAANQAIAAGSVSATIGPTGSVSVNLVPNAGASPAGTYYTAIYHLNDGTVSQEYWVVPAVTSTTIGSVMAQLAPATVAVQPVSKSYVDDSISAITGNYVPLVGGTMSGPLQLSSDPISSNQAATKHYADALAATKLPLTGGSLSGTLNTPNIVTKLPRVNVTHPDFGSGCPNAADPTGANDSTCAIQAAYTWAVAHPQGDVSPSLYFPAGTYKISSPLRVSCEMHIQGDGEAATVIEGVNNSANIFTITNASSGSSQPDQWVCNGSISDMTLYASGGHLYTATLLELDNVVGYTIRNIRGANGGGRGLSTQGSTERLKVIDTEWDTDRWPIVAIGNEQRYLDTNIASGGEDARGYCWGVNCPTGAFPSYQWNTGTLVSANADGTNAYFYVKGSYHDSTPTSTAPIYPGNYFEVTGTTGTVLDGYYKSTTVTNGVTSDPSGSCSASSECFEVIAPSTASGTATVSSAKWLPALAADNDAGSFYLSGAADTVIGGSIKANWFNACFETNGVSAGLIEGFYCEGYPVNGQPHMEASILAGGMMPTTTTTGPIVSSAVPVASTLWFPGYVNDPADATTVGYQEYKIYPEDYVRGSSNPSAYVSGVEQGQYEIVGGIFAGDGQLHITIRNIGGSTAPANATWPSGSIISQIPTANSGVLKVADSHFEGVDLPGSNWAAYCVDSNSLICGEEVVGDIPNGYSVAFSGNYGSGAAIATVDFDDIQQWNGCRSNENVGPGCIKVSTIGSVNITGPSAAPLSEAYEVHTGQFLSNDDVVAVTGADGVIARYGLSVPAQGEIASDNYGPAWSSLVSGYEDSTLGGNPGASTFFGREFDSSWCDYDVPASAGAHSLNRFCMKGGPTNTGANAGWEYDTWNGTAWVNAFTLANSGSNTANATVSGSLTAGGGLLAQLGGGSEADVLRGTLGGSNPFFDITYQGTVKSNGGLALSTIINTASALTLTEANKNVIANASSGAQTITLPSCSTAWPDRALPTGLELTVIKSDASSNAVTLQTVSSQRINYAGAWSQTLSMTSPGKRTLVCGPDYNWYAY